MMNGVDDNVVAELRRRFIEEKTIIAVLGYMTERLQLTAGSRLPAIVYLQEAFCLTLGQAKSIGAWVFFDGGTWSNEDIEKEFNSEIARNESKWRQRQ